MTWNPDLGPGIAPYNKHGGERHVIERVHYVNRGNPDLAPLECTCGWAGIAGDFQRHRTAAGARKPARGWEAMAFGGVSFGHDRPKPGGRE